MNKFTFIPGFILATTLLATMSSAGATGDVDIKSGLYKTLCVEDLSTGYKWTGSKWQSANFTTTKYLLQKVDPTDKMAGKCAQAVRENPGDMHIGFKAC